MKEEKAIYGWEGLRTKALGLIDALDRWQRAKVSNFRRHSSEDGLPFDTRNSAPSSNVRGPPGPEGPQPSSLFESSHTPPPAS